MRKKCLLLIMYPFHCVTQKSSYYAIHNLYKYWFLVCLVLNQIIKTRCIPPDAASRPRARNSASRSSGSSGRRRMPRDTAAPAPRRRSPPRSPSPKTTDTSNKYTVLKTSMSYNLLLKITRWRLERNQP